MCQSCLLSHLLKLSKTLLMVALYMHDWCAFLIELLAIEGIVLLGKTELLNADY